MIVLSAGTPKSKGARGRVERVTSCALLSAWPGRAEDCPPYQYKLCKMFI